MSLSAEAHDGLGRLADADSQRLRALLEAGLRIGASTEIRVEVGGRFDSGHGELPGGGGMEVGVSVSHRVPAIGLEAELGYGWKDRHGRARNLYAGSSAGGYGGNALRLGGEFTLGSRTAIPFKVELFRQTMHGAEADRGLRIAFYSLLGAARTNARTPDTHRNTPEEPPAARKEPN